MVICSICLLVQYLAGPDAKPLSGLDCITKAPILFPFPKPQDEGNIICPECARKKIMAEMEERNE